MIFCLLFAGLSFSLYLFQNLSVLLILYMLACLCFLPTFHLSSSGSFYLLFFFFKITTEIYLQ